MMDTSTFPQVWIVLVYLFLTLLAFKYFKVFDSLKPPLLILAALILYGFFRGLDLAGNLFIAWIMLFFLGILKSFVAALDREDEKRPRSPWR